MKSKIICSLGLILCAVMTFCDANGACPIRQRGKMPQDVLRRTQARTQARMQKTRARVEWTRAERERHVANIVAQTESIRSVVQGAERLDLQQTGDLLDQIYFTCQWIVQLESGSHKRFGDDYYVIAPNKAGYGDRMGARFFREQLMIRKEGIQYTRTQLQQGRIEGTEEQLRVLGSAVDDLETVLNQMGEKMPQADNK